MGRKEDGILRSRPYSIALFRQQDSPAGGAVAVAEVHGEGDEGAIPGSLTTTSGQVRENAVYSRVKGLEIVDLTKVAPGGLFKPEEIIPDAADCDALVVQFAKTDASVIAAMGKCKVIARYFIGFDNIDMAAATEKGIWVASPFIPSIVCNFRRTAEFLLLS